MSTSALLVVRWQRGGPTALLIGAGACLGAGLGSAWELTVIMAIGLVVLVATGPRRPDGRATAVAAGALVVVTAAAWCFVLVRAHQDPVLNWGDATNLSRLVALIKQQDFAATGTNGAGLGRVGAAVGGLVRDFGLGAIVLAIAGVSLRWRKLEPSTRWFLGVVGFANLGAVILFAGFGSIQGFGTTLVQGGYLIDTMIVVAVLAALGATAIVTEVEARLAGGDGPGTAMFGRGLVTTVTVVVLVAATIVPSILVHHKYANLRVPAYADDYGHDVLAALPRNSVLLVWGEEFSFPMIYRQELEHERPDVTVLSANGIDLAWVRAQFTRRLDLGSTLQPGAPTQELVPALIKKLRQTRPVYLDTNAMLALTSIVGYRTDGLVGEVVDGTGPHAPTDIPEISARLVAAENHDRMIGGPSNRVPNRTAFFFYERAHIELAKVYALSGDVTGTTHELQRAVALFPSDRATAAVLEKVNGPGGRDSLPLVASL